MKSTFWTVEHDPEGVVTATFRNGPMNYYTDAAVSELGELVSVWEAAPPRVVILTGGVPGKFITHFDPVEILSGLEDTERIVVRGPVRNNAVNDVLNGLARLASPVIAALNGDAMGFGFELALASDIRIGERGDHRYGLPEVTLGITPGTGGTQRLSRVVGLPTALDLVMGAKILDPEAAERVGLLTSLADDALAAARELADRYVRLPALPIALAKRALHQGHDAPLSAALTIESDASVRAKLGPAAVRRLTQYVAIPEAERREQFLETPPEP